MAMSFKGAPFPPEVILMGLRWSLVSPLSTRHVEERMEERGVNVDHATINRWGIKSSPQLEEVFHRRKRPVWTSWRLDEMSKRRGSFSTRRLAVMAACPRRSLLMVARLTRQRSRATTKTPAPRLKSAR